MEAFAVGMSHCLMKPMKKQTLQLALNEVLEKQTASELPSI